MGNRMEMGDLREIRFDFRFSRTSFFSRTIGFDHGDIDPKESDHNDSSIVVVSYGSMSP